MFPLREKLPAMKLIATAGIARGIHKCAKLFYLVYLLFAVIAKNHRVNLGFSNT